MRLCTILLLLIAGSAAAEQPEFEWIPWAQNIEEARARAAAENRFVLAIVTPWDWWHHEAGYEGAEKVHEAGYPYKGDLAHLRRIEPGAIKERAILTALFCNPDLAALVSEHFVPVRVRMCVQHFRYKKPPDWDDPLIRLGTTRSDAHPPALIFAAADGSLLHQVVRMGTFSPHLVYRTCLAVCERHGHVPQPTPKSSLDRARSLMLAGDLDGAEQIARNSQTLRGSALLGEIHLLAGRDREARAALDPLRPGKGELRFRVYSALALAEERLGNRERARELWQRVSTQAEAGPWATRAKLYLANGGPRPLEWETFRHIDADPWTPTTECGGQRAPVRAAVEYLLAHQLPDGSWDQSHNRHGLVSRDGRPIGEIVPRTALCVSALRAVLEDLHPKQAERATRAIRKGIAFVTGWSENPQQKVWQLTYALHLELELLRDQDPAASRDRVGKLLEALAEIEDDGGWTYSSKPGRNHTFNTAPILILLREAKRLGVGIDDAMIERATAFLERNRVGQRSIFHYGTKMEPMTGLKSGKGDCASCMRATLCELALFKRDTTRLSKALEIFFANMEAVRFTARIHESWVEIDTLQDSYRYFFGTWYAARAIRLLPPPARGEMSIRLRERILRVQEIDGSFVDSQMVGKGSSTALAILALAELR